MKPENEVSRTATPYVCSEDGSPIFRIDGEIDDGQGEGGTESVCYFWCDNCGDEPEDRVTIFEDGDLTRAFVS